MAPSSRCMEYGVLCRLINIAVNKQVLPATAAEGVGHLMQFVLGRNRFSCPCIAYAGLIWVTKGLVA